jgi:hypothetical protein
MNSQLDHSLHREALPGFLAPERVTTCSSAKFFHGESFMASLAWRLFHEITAMYRAPSVGCPLLTSTRPSG